MDRTLRIARYALSPPRYSVVPLAGTAPIYVGSAPPAAGANAAALFLFYTTLAAAVAVLAVYLMTLLTSLLPEAPRLF